MTANGDRPGEVGDVYAFFLERPGRWAAVQVIDLPEEGIATLAAFDWTGSEAPADVSVLADADRMIRDFLFWEPEEFVQKVALPPPPGFRLIGVLPVRGREAECRRSGDWCFDGRIEQQLWWNALPGELRARFKAGLAEEEVYVVPGMRYRRSGELVETVSRATTTFDGEAALLTEEFELTALRSWPLLVDLRLSGWRDDLLPFLESSPLMRELTLRAHGRRELDLSRTSLRTLRIDQEGLRRLVLPETLDMLILHGDSDGPLRVEAEEHGRWIRLQLTGGPAPVDGLERLRALRIDAIDELSVEDVWARHPGLRSLTLFGSPGVAREIASLAAFPQLEELWLGDLFGYGAADFPGPGGIPRVRRIALDSVPADVARQVRKAYRGAPGIDVDVRRPRNDTWREQNLGNPLRHWEGQEGLPQAVARKANAAWRTAIAVVRRPGVESATIVSATSVFLDVIRALDEKHGFLHTLEREQVVEAVEMLAAGLSTEQRARLEPAAEEALDG
ncbi:hypothetical protein [Microbacterium sp.]|uniref:hypothetical protein n=1 Tax=Microbacterium sp. TaxID=51671 RepID=UPI0033417A59